jgi:hypothetical protein
MADKNEADIKALRGQIEALSRKVETMEKSSRALPDPAALAKLVTRMDALEKTVANKKDMKPEHEQALKQAMKTAAEQQARVKEIVTQAQFAKLEALVQAALRK